MLTEEGRPRADNPALYFAPPVGALLALEPKFIRTLSERTS
jgi:hypothetical protein